MILKSKLESGYKIAALILLLQLSCSTAPALAKSSKAKDSATVEPTILHMREGERMLKLNDYEAAADEFLQSCYFARNKYNPEGWLQLGRCYMQLKNWSKAIDALSTHLGQTTEKAPDANCDIAECYIEIGQFEKADRHITQARIEADYKNHRPYYTMGKLLERMGRYGEALGAYTTSLDQRPWTYTDAWLGRARCYRKMKPPDYKEALADYKQMVQQGNVLKKNADWVEAYYGMAECYYKRGDHQGAIDHLLEELKLDPDNFDGHIALAHIFDEEKHVTSAINQYEHSLRTAPKGYNVDSINKRIVFLQGELKGKQEQAPIRPSPAMRQQQQEYEEAQPKQVNRAPGDSGF